MQQYTAHSNAQAAAFVSLDPLGHAAAAEGVTIILLLSLLLLLLLLSSCILCIAEYTNEGLRAGRDGAGRAAGNIMRGRWPRDTMGRAGTIVLAAAGAAATTMHGARRPLCARLLSCAAENRRARARVNRRPPPSANGFSRARISPSK